MHGDRFLFQLNFGLTRDLSQLSCLFACVCVPPSKISYIATDPMRIQHSKRRERERDTHSKKNIEEIKTDLNDETKKEKRLTLYSSGKSKFVGPCHRDVPAVFVCPVVAIFLFCRYGCCFCYA